eukprot:CAMPEP_0184220594 /NCGR_PEP_ID=MMETSP0976-20121227/17788_1 /TAXON_ID=483370 /ORGANISM="non described non described, Strain CCMP2097" /LENGTH=73 /DNA_ID=CAMNT_0026525459 /DNA_START=198 /DNA_END=415 /DNA_ORIENTATION=+
MSAVFLEEREHVVSGLARDELLVEEDRHFCIKGESRPIRGRLSRWCRARSELHGDLAAAHDRAVHVVAHDLWL